MLSLFSLALTFKNEIKRKLNITIYRFLYHFGVSRTCYIFYFDGNFCNTNNNSNNIPAFDTIFLRYSLGAILETFFLNFLVILIFRTIPFLGRIFYGYYFYLVFPLYYIIVAFTIFLLSIQWA